MQHRVVVIAILAFGCGKELNPKFCREHPTDERCTGATQPDSARAGDSQMLTCPTSYDVMVAGSTSRYLAVDDVDDWLSAAQLCAMDAALGANTHLAVISSDAERMALSGVMDRPRWVGHTDRLTAGTFLAVTDEPGVYPELVMGLQPPWGTGGTTGDCAVMTPPTLALYARSCDAEDASYLCECDAYPNDTTNY